MSSESDRKQDNGKGSLHHHLESVPEYCDCQGDGSRQSLENHGKLDEIWRFSNKKFDEDHDMHGNLALAEDYPRPTKRGEYQYASGVMGIAYNPFLDPEARNACMTF